MKKILFFAVLSVIAFSCEDDAYVKFEKKKYSLHYDESLQLKIISSEKNLNLFVYNVETPNVVSVSDDGIVSGLFVGSTNVIVSNGDLSAKCEVTVEPYEKLFTVAILPIMGNLKKEAVRQFELRNLIAEEENSLTFAPLDNDLGIDSLKYVFEDDVLTTLYAYLKEDVTAGRAELYLKERYAYNEAGGFYKDHYTDAVVRYESAENEIVFQW